MFTVVLSAGDLRRAAALAERVHRPLNARNVKEYDTTGVLVAVHISDTDGPTVRLICADTSDSGTLAVLVPEGVQVYAPESQAVDMNILGLPNVTRSGKLPDSTPVTLAYDEMLFGDQTLTVSYELEGHKVNVPVQCKPNPAIWKLMLPTMIYAWGTIASEALRSSLKNIATDGMVLKYAEFDMTDQRVHLAVRSNSRWNRTDMPNQEQVIGQRFNTAARRNARFISLKALNAIVATCQEAVEVCLLATASVISNRYVMFRSGNVAVIASYQSKVAL